MTSKKLAGGCFGAAKQILEASIDTLSPSQRLDLAEIQCKVHKPVFCAASSAASHSRVSLPCQTGAWSDSLASVSAVCAAGPAADVRIQALLVQGDVCFHCRRGDAAIAAYEQALGAAIEDAAALTASDLRAQCVARLSWAFVEEGGDRPVPPTLLQQLQGLDPASPHKAFANAVVFRRVGRRAEGRALVDRLVQASPANPDVQLVLAQYCADAGDHARTQAAVSVCLAAFPACVRALQLYSATAQSAGFRWAALHAAQHAAEMAPDAPRVLAEYGLAALAAGQARLAMDVVQHQMLALPPTPRGMHAALVVASKVYNAGVEHARVLACAVAVAASPTAPDATKSVAEYVRGNCLARHHATWTDAEACLTAAAELDPSDTLWKTSMANLYRDWGRLGEALHLNQQQLAAHPSDPNHVANVAQCLEYAGRADDALAVLDRYLNAQSPASWTTKEDFVPLLIAVKLMWCAPHAPLHFSRLLKRLETAASLPKSTVLELRVHLPTHWAYAYFLRRLLAHSPPPTLELCGDGGVGAGASAAAGHAPGGESRQPPRPPPRDVSGAPAPTPDFPGAWPVPPVVSRAVVGYPARPLFLVGDSHVLSYAWRTVTWQGEDRLLVPRLDTGLKVLCTRAVAVARVADLCVCVVQAWHLRPGTAFVTHSAWHVMLRVRRCCSGRCCCRVVDVLCALHCCCHSGRASTPPNVTSWCAPVRLIAVKGCRQPSTRACTPAFQTLRRAPSLRTSAGCLPRRRRTSSECWC